MREACAGVRVRVWGCAGAHGVSFIQERPLALMFEEMIKKIKWKNCTIVNAFTFSYPRAHDFLPFPPLGFGTMAGPSK